MSDLDLNLSKLFNFVKPAELNKNSNEYTTEEVKENFDLLQKDEKGNVSLEAGAKLFEMMYMDKDVDEAEDDFLAAIEAISGIDGDASSFSLQDFQGANEYFQNVLSDYATESEGFNNDTIDGLKSFAGQLQSQKSTDLEEKLGFDVISTDDDKIKYNDDGSAYVEVEEWSSGSGKNDCLKRIIENNYDLEAMGIKKYSEEYYALEKEIMDANPHIYGEDSGRKSRTGDRNETYLHTGDKMNLPGLDKVDKASAKEAVKTALDELKKNKPAEDDKSVGGQIQELMSSDEISQVIGTVGVLLENGTPENILSIIGEYSPENMMSLIQQYETETGSSLISDIKNKFSKDESLDLISNIAEDVKALVLEGDEAAIEEFCEQVVVELVAKETDGVFTKMSLEMEGNVPADLQAKIEAQMQIALEQIGATQQPEATDDKEPVGTGETQEAVLPTLSDSDVRSIVLKIYSGDTSYFAENLENYNEADVVKILMAVNEHADDYVPTFPGNGDFAELQAGRSSVIEMLLPDDYTDEQKGAFYDKVVNSCLDMATQNKDDSILKFLGKEIYNSIEQYEYAQGYSFHNDLARNKNGEKALILNSVINSDNIQAVKQLNHIYEKESIGYKNEDLFDLIGHKHTLYNGLTNKESKDAIVNLTQKMIDNAKETGVPLTDSELSEIAENVLDFVVPDDDTTYLLDGGADCKEIVDLILNSENLTNAEKQKIIQAFNTHAKNGKIKATTTNGEYITFDWLVKNNSSIINADNPYVSKLDEIDS